MEEVEGTFIYKGYVKSLDDKKTDVYESMSTGLMISSEVLKNYSGDVFTLEIEIEDLKPKEQGVAAPILTLAAMVQAAREKKNNL